MRCLCKLVTVWAIVLLAQTAMGGAIYLDEDFESGTPFVDRSPVVSSTTMPVLPLMQGINLRAHDADFVNPKVQIGTAQGTVVSTRAYRGSKSYRLQSGQSLAVTPGQLPGSDYYSGFRFWQFAISANVPTNIAVGTEVGRYEIYYSKHGKSNLSPDTTIQLKLVVRSSGKADLICTNTNANLGTLTSSTKDWMQVSIIAQVGVDGGKDTEATWVAYNPVTGNSAGPGRPIPTGVVIYAQNASGVAKTSISRSSGLGADWGNQFMVNVSTAEIGWKFEAKGGGSLYLDNLYWDAGGHQSDTKGFDVEQAERLEPFSPEIELSSTLFRDNLVLQRGIPIPIWGRAAPGQSVTVKINGQSRPTIANARGRWQATLSNMSAGGPYDLTVDGKTSIVLHNVMLGDVWLCSGQSNMAMSVVEADNATSEIAHSTNSRLRLFTVPLAPAGAPLENLTGGDWKLCTPDNVTSFSATAYYFGRELQKSLPGVTIGLINSSVGATRAEDWTSLDALQSNSEFHPLIGTPGMFGIVATTLFNGMINPLMPYGIKGVVWYQGEFNAGGNGRSLQYRRLLPLMIRDWRNRWDLGDFPFLLVQLPGFGTTDWEELRESQLMTLKQPNTAMAVTIDIGDKNNIHPTHKQEVGRRLALAARGKVYGQSITYSGPIYRSQTIEGSKIRLSFDHVDGGLVNAIDTATTLTGFEVAGSDLSFTAATATIDKSNVLVSAPSISSPAYVRYCWAGYPEPMGSLYNTGGLPASPFRTDPAPGAPMAAGDWRRYR